MGPTLYVLEESDDGSPLVWREQEMPEELLKIRDAGCEGVDNPVDYTHGKDAGDEAVDRDFGE